MKTWVSFYVVLVLSISAHATAAQVAASTKDVNIDKSDVDQKNYDVSIQCESRITKKASIAFTWDYSSRDLEITKSYLNAAPKEGEFGSSQTGAPSIWIGLFGNKYHYETQSDSGITRDSMGRLSFSKVKIGGLHDIQSLPVDEKRESSSCEPLEISRTQFKQHLLFANVNTEKISFDSFNLNKEAYTYESKNALQEKVKKGDQLDLTFICRKSVKVQNNADYCR